MDTVREHLSAALQAVVQEKETCALKLRELVEQERQLKMMLGMEKPETAPSASGEGPNRLALLIDHMLDTEMGATLGEMMEVAVREGVPFKDGRSFQAVLAGLAAHKRAKRDPNGVWHKVREE